MKKRLVIGITGASGAVYGIRMLQLLSQVDEWESHLVISSSGLMTATHELEMDRAQIEGLADVVHNVRATSTRRRRSFNMTSAARVIRLSDSPCATAASVRIEQGAITMPLH